MVTSWRHLYCLSTSSINKLSQWHWIRDSPPCWYEWLTTQTTGFSPVWCNYNPAWGAWSDRWSCYHHHCWNRWFKVVFLRSGPRHFPKTTNQMGCGSHGFCFICLTNGEVFLTAPEFFQLMMKMLPAGSDVSCRVISWQPADQDVRLSPSWGFRHWIVTIISSY